MDEARLWLYGVARRVLANHRRGELRRPDRHRAGLPARPGHRLSSGSVTLLVVAQKNDPGPDPSRPALF
ncbi:hypothetical protein ABZ801_25820 [Actinomadura sp. NPDC047616]|uniref:hypothetical protein n=1 Tax=Actinomadura sp. NPDC047616 TaxID=3155914 RepID=UPI0033FB25D6